MKKEFKELIEKADELYDLNSVYLKNPEIEKMFGELKYFPYNILEFSLQFDLKQKDEPFVKYLNILEEYFAFIRKPENLDLFNPNECKYSKSVLSIIYYSSQELIKMIQEEQIKIACKKEFIYCLEMFSMRPFIFFNYRLDAIQELFLQIDLGAKKYKRVNKEDFIKRMGNRWYKILDKSNLKKTPNYYLNMQN